MRIPAEKKDGAGHPEAISVEPVVHPDFRAVLLVFFWNSAQRPWQGGGVRGGEGRQDGPKLGEGTFAPFSFSR